MGLTISKLKLLLSERLLVIYGDECQTDLNKRGVLLLQLLAASGQTFRSSHVKVKAKQ